MSLVNEALKKARLEAARQDVKDRGVPYPRLDRSPSGPGTRLGLAAGLIVALALAGLVGYGLYRLGLAAGGGEAPQTATAEGTSAPAESIAEPVSAEAAEAIEPATRTTPHSDNTGEGAESPAQTRAEAGGTRRAPQPSATPTSALSSLAPDPARLAAATGSEEDRPARAPSPSVAAPVTAPTATVSRTGDGRERQNPAPAESGATATLAGVGTVTLGGIAWSGDRPFALVNGKVVAPGDAIAGFEDSEVEVIDPDRVTLTVAGRRIVLALE